MMKQEFFMWVLHAPKKNYILFIEQKDSLNMNLFSFMRDKQVKKYKEWFDELDKAAAKHLVKLGVEKDWKEVYRKMKNRRRRRERTT
jgi:valyl-tRNA synthetase